MSTPNPIKSKDSVLDIGASVVNQVVITGYITHKDEHQGTYITTVRLEKNNRKEDDQSVAIRSKTTIGAINDDVSIPCYLSGWNQTTPKGTFNNIRLIKADELDKFRR